MLRKLTLISAAAGCLSLALLVGAPAGAVPAAIGFAAPAIETDVSQVRHARCHHRRVSGWSNCRRPPGWTSPGKRKGWKGRQVPPGWQKK